MRIVYLGTPEPAIHPLQHLLEAQSLHQVVGVISQPAKPVGRKRQLQDPPVAAYAKKEGLQVLQPDSAKNDQFLKDFAALQPDLAITCAFGQILPQKFLDIPKRGTINIHPSKLPQLRGATPIPTTLLEGASSTHVTILFTVRKMDAGPLILQKPFDIKSFETTSMLTQRLFQESGPLLLEAIEKLQDPDYEGSIQNEDEATHCSKISKEDGRINWQDDFKTIFHKFLAYTTWPTAFTHLHGKRLVIEEMKLSEDPAAGTPGAFLFNKKENSLTVSCQSGSVLITKIKPEGSKSMDIRSFMNGLKPGSLNKFEKKDL